jgi:hypothetical protein
MDLVKTVVSEAVREHIDQQIANALISSGFEAEVNVTSEGQLWAIVAVRRAGRPVRHFKVQVSEVL